MKLVLETEFHTLWRDDDRGLLVYVRNQKQYVDVAEFQKDVNATEAFVMQVLDFGLVLDSRQVRGRNDKEFEEVAQKTFSTMFSKLAKIAILLRTEVGVLQSQRMTQGQDSGGCVLITLDVDEAFAFATTIRD